MWALDELADAKDAYTDARESGVGLAAVKVRLKWMLIRFNEINAELE